MDDCFLRRTPRLTENIDYMCKKPIPEQHLYICWRQNNLIAIKSQHDDISSIIPSTNSKRLENITWRRWYKDLLGLDEVDPAEINWDKSHDITWLYGPKYTIEETTPSVELPSTPDLAKCTESYGDSDIELVSSVLLEASLMTFDDVSLVASESDDEEEECWLKPALKKRSGLSAGSGKKVKFNYIVSSREFVNGMAFDYDFLEPLCL